MVALDQDVITFQRERFNADLEKELLPLALEHNKEIGGVISDVTVKVPREMYEQLDANDLLRIYTIRESGELKGYNIFAVILHPEYNQLTAQHDAMFVHPSVRHGFNSMRFLRWCDDQLKQNSVLFVTQHVTIEKDYSPILKRLGYKASETIYIKRLN